MVNVNDGAVEGDLCAVEGCAGVLQDDGTGNGCSCHLNPPCGDCETAFDRLYCPICGWKASDNN